MDLSSNSSLRNGFSAVKAVTAAQLSMASHGVHSVTLDEAIEAMRLTASDMSVKYKETSLSVRHFIKFVRLSTFIQSRFQGLAVRTIL
jgi:hypothetical protein